MKQNTINIDKEFKGLIPPIGYEEFLGLEESIKKEGNRDELVIWKGKNILLDGHNRYKICIAHNIPLKKPFIELEFESKEKAKLWIIKNQFGRRNLSSYQRGVLALKYEELISLGQGARTDLKPNGQKLNTRKEISKIVGVGEGTIERVKEIEKKATNVQKEKLNKGERTVSSVYKDIHDKEIKEGIREIPMPKGNFSVIYADPPWEYQWATRGAAAHHYNTEGIDKLKKIKIPTTENAVMFMWATNPKLNEALELMESWGFEYKTNMVWVKDKFGTGWWVRGQHELLLIGTKGKVKTPPAHLRPSSVIKAQRTKHSKKPEIYDILEKMFPNQKCLELFARNKRENWKSWGNEI